MADAVRDRLGVWLGSTRVGMLSRLPDDRNVFTFDPSYREDAERPMLSLAYLSAGGELRAEPDIAQMKAPAFFANLLPEGPLRRYLARGVGANPMRDFPLLAALGHDLPGAVRMLGEREASRELDEVLSEPDGADAPTRLRFSLAGVQMKFSAEGTPERGLTIPLGGRGGHWILKLPSREYERLPENEHAMMRLAAQVGLNVAETGLVAVEDVQGLPEEFRKGGESALWVKRFDRAAKGRIHMEDFNQIYRQFPEQKYSQRSYTMMARDLHTVAGMPAVREFVQRLVFCAGTGNADMHLKNWSVLYLDGRTPSLSPAYDLVSTIEYIPDDGMALSLASTKKVVEFDEARLKRLAAKAQLPERIVVEAGLETAERLVGAWSRFTRDNPMRTSLKTAVSERLRSFPLTRRFL